MKFSKEKIDQLAAMVNIDLPHQHKGIVAKQLEKMVNWVNHLQGVDTAGITIKPMMCAERNIFAHHEPTSPLPIKKVLMNAPQHDGVYFHIPPTSHKPQK